MKRIAILLLALTLPAHAATLFVSHQGDDSDGLSWESALISIGGALSGASAGDDIWVASGTYNESIQMVTGVSLYGGFAGTETDEEFEKRNWRTNETTIDATGLDTSVVVAANEATLDGFTITGGY
ncbi:MAG: DUF1565 domain-containing protein, partial [Candidatus Omnitrophica bacterium]|nr:DUF1565 domain-containing protein [Candidatus Omnitrophota bacterium]